MEKYANILLAKLKTIEQKMCTSHIGLHAGTKIWRAKSVTEDVQLWLFMNWEMHNDITMRYNFIFTRLEKI
jgi:hypothetical protein